MPESQLHCTTAHYTVQSRECFDAAQPEFRPNSDVPRPVSRTSLQTEPSVVPNCSRIPRCILQCFPYWLHIWSLDISCSVPTPTPHVRRWKLEVYGFRLFLPKQAIVRPEPRPVLRIRLWVIGMSSKSRICSNDCQIASSGMNDCRRRYGVSHCVLKYIQPK